MVDVVYLCRDNTKKDINMVKKLIDYLQKWFGKKSDSVVEVPVVEASVKPEKTPKKST